MRFDVETRVNARRGIRSAVLVSLFAMAFGASACTAFSFGDGTGGAGGSGGSTPTGGAGGGGAMTTGGGGSAAGEGGSAGAIEGGSGGTADAAQNDAAVDASDDVVDRCPDDPMKTAPGICGCGMPDDDSDGDGIADCLDGCPSDPTKTAAGACGCFIADTDTDHDGVADCLDACPKDATRSRPGTCGCGFPDNTPLCLIHRYSFDGTAGGDAGIEAGAGAEAGVSADAGAGVEAGAGAEGGGGTTLVMDSINGANGTAFGATLTGTGAIALTGGTQYIALPGGLISTIGNSVTFEAWVTWNGAAGAAWQRIFDFGTSDMGAGNQGTGLTFVFLTPRSGTTNVLFSSYVGGGLAEISAPAVMPDSVMQHVALVIDGGPADAGGAMMSLYLQGALVSQVMTANQLGTVVDTNNWLGRSQFALDPYFVGVYHEFRIYSAARTAAQIAASFNRGPDALPAQ
jgi:hypothetical protein